MSIEKSILYRTVNNSLSFMDVQRGGGVECRWKGASRGVVWSGEGRAEENYLFSLIVALSRALRVTRVCAYHGGHKDSYLQTSC